MTDKRFHIGVSPHHFYVLDLSLEEFKKLSASEEERHVVAKIQIGGMVSKQLARTWAEQIAEQLNRFDVSNVAIAKLT